MPIDGTPTGERNSTTPIETDVDDANTEVLGRNQLQTNNKKGDSHRVSRRRWLKLSAAAAAGVCSIGTVTAGSDKRSPSCRCIGGGEGYQNTVRRRDATRVVTNLQTLRDALDKASRGEIIYINDNAEIDMGTNQLSIPERVTLASGRGVRRGRNTSSGALLYTDDYVGRFVNRYPGYEGRPRSNIYANGNARITGLRIRGPDPGGLDHERDLIHPDSRWRHASMGVLFEGSSNEIDNCGVFGWYHAAVTSNENTHHIHHNRIYNNAHHNVLSENANYLGYGVVVDEGVPLIEYNYFDENRHSIAGTGRGGYELRYNVFGPTTTHHVIDMHGPGGTYMHIHHNTVRCVYGSGYREGAPIEAIHIRGVPEKRTPIENNWFYHSEKPTYPGDGEAIQQSASGEYTNLTIQNNHYGRGEPADDIGHPRD